MEKPETARSNPLLLIPALFLGVAFIAYITWPRKSWVLKPHRLPATSCPDPAIGETPEDCPWAGVARLLQSEQGGARSVLPALQTELPALYEKMAADSARKSWLGLWGRSINFDELAKGVIVPPALVESLFELLSPPSGVPTVVEGWEIVHAGIEHTYGYLFSTLPTRYGFKRARWVRDTIDRGFGFPPPTIAPLPSEGTLFSNVTYFAGRIAFRNDPDLKKILESGSQGVSPAVLGFDYGSLKITRLEEEIAAPYKVTLRTDLVPFTRKVPGDPNSYLLVYSVSDTRPGPDSGTKLVTVFPVESSFVPIVLNPANLGEGKPIITRYNCFVEGISGHSVTGTRRKL